MLENGDHCNIQHFEINTGWIIQILHQWPWVQSSHHFDWWLIVPAIYSAHFVTIITVTSLILPMQTYLALKGKTFFLTSFSSLFLSKRKNSTSYFCFILIKLICRRNAPNRRSHLLSNWTPSSRWEHPLKNGKKWPNAGQENPKIGTIDWGSWQKLRLHI